MRDLMTYARECMEELDVINVPYVRPVCWKVNTRAKKFYGQCTRSRYNDKTFTIDIAAKLLGDDVDEMAVKNVIHHELVHTIPGCFNHGKEFVYWCNVINREYGYTVETKAHDYVQKYNVPATEYKYAVRCKKCGAIVRRVRMSDLIKYPSIYSCGKCGGDFERIDYSAVQRAACKAG